MADPLDRFRVGPASEQAPVAPDADPLGRFKVDTTSAPIPTAPTSLNQEFQLGVQRGGHSFVGMMGGLASMVGRSSGIESLEQAGLNFAVDQSEAANRYGLEGEVERFSEVEDAGGFFKWAAAGIGEAIPSLASAASGGGIGAVAAKKVVENRLKSVLAGRVTRNLMKKGVAREEAAAAANRILRSDDGQRWLAEATFRGKSGFELSREAMRTGGTKGLIGVSSAPQIGAVDMELQEAGVDSAITSLIAGVAGGALEALPIVKFMDKLFPGVDTQLARSFVKDFAVATGQQHMLEGGTEAAQEMIQLAALAYHDPSFDPWSPEARTRVIDAYAAGALVGTVMGAGASAVSDGLPRLRDRAKKPPIPTLPKYEFRPPEKEQYPDGFEPADNTVFQEIRSRLYATVGPKVESAVNSARDKLAPVMEALNTDLNPGMSGEGVRLFTVLKDAHESFVEDHKAILDNMHGYFRDQTRRIYEAATAIRDPEQRAAFIEKEVAAVEKKVASFADTLRRRAAARDQNLEAEVDNMDFDDDMLTELGLTMTEDGEVVEVAQDAPEEVVDVARAEPGDVDAPVAITFGKNQKRPTVDTSGRESVQGYDSEDQARLGLNTLLEEIPNATEEDFTIRPQEDGTFVLETQNPDFREDVNFNETLRRSNKKSQKANPEGNYEFEEDEWQGGLGWSKPSLHLSDLAWAGITSLPKNMQRPTLWEGFQASIAKMLERGMINGETAQKMLDQYRQENADQINDPTPEIYAPVTNYPTRNAAVAGMLKVRDAVADALNIDWGWPKGAVDVIENADGTFSWGIRNPDMIKRLRRKDPAHVKAILDAIKAERRAEKLASEPMGPGGRDVGVTADPRGTFAGEARTTTDPIRTGRTGEGQRTATRTKTGGRQTGEFSGTSAAATDTTPFADDTKVAPEALPSEFDARFQRNNPELGKVDRRKRDNTKTAPKARQKQTEEDNRILKRIARPAEVKALIGMEFDKDGSLTKAIGDLARFVQKTLGLANEIIVMDDVGLKLMIEQGMVSDPVFKQTLEDPNVHARNIRIGDRSYIYLSNRTLSDPSLTTLALGHELGHHLYQVAWDGLTEKAQQNLRNASKAKTDEEFNEWMADQLAAWIVNRRLPKNAVEKFFFTVGSKIRQLYNFLQGGGGANVQKRFALNETFGDFADAVAQRATQTGSPGYNPLSEAAQKEWFKNDGVTMYKWFGKPTKDNMELPFDTREVTEGTKKAMQSLEQKYPVIAKNAQVLRRWVASAYTNLAAPSTSVMKSLAKQVPVAGEVVKIFGRQDYGKPKLSRNYHQRVNYMKGQFLSRFDNVRNQLRKDIQKAEPQLKGARLEAAVNLGMMKLGRSLRSKEGNLDAKFTPLEQEVRNLFDEMHAYARKSGLPVGKIINYVPRQFDKAKLVKGRQEIIDHLVDNKIMGLYEARRFYESLLDPNANDGRMTMDPVGTPSFANMNSRTIEDPFFAQFYDNNLDALVANYVNSVVKRGEFNRFLGEPMPAQHDMTPKEAVKAGLWDPKKKFHQIIRQARKEGATDEQVQTIEKYIDANLGQLGRDDIPSGLRKWMAGVMAYQNMRVLAFTVFASLPDMVGPAIRSKDMKGAWKTFKKELHNIAQNDNELSALARAYGVISDAHNEHIMTEYVDNHYMSPTLRKWNDNFFKYTGLNYYTDFTRKYALAVGIDYIKQMADDTSSKDEKTRFRAEAALKELGITKKDVHKWLAAGKPTHMSVQNEKHMKVAEALVQFVDESIMRPNPAQRPIMASHPAAMLVYHLKGYLYAVQDVVVGRLIHNIQEAQGVQNTLWAMSPAFAMMALTAVGLELREIIQYAGSNRTPRTDRMDSFEYVWELVERSGLTGISQLMIDFEGASDRGMSGIAGISGPTAAQIGDLLSRPSSQNIPRAVPLLGQTQGGRDAIRALL
jgi:hypothetical protein